MVAGIQKIQEEVSKTGVVKVFPEFFLTDVGGKAEIYKRDLEAVIENIRNTDISMYHTAAVDIKQNFQKLFADLKNLFGRKLFALLKEKSFQGISLHIFQNKKISPLDIDHTQKLRNRRMGEAGKDHSLPLDKSSVCFSGRRPEIFQDHRPVLIVFCQIADSVPALAQPLFYCVFPGLFQTDH